jgi:hypothetical protein
VHTLELPRCLGFLCAQLSRAARAHLTLREIENADTLAAIHGLDERATAGEFDVVTVRADGKQV